MHLEQFLSETCTQHVEGILLESIFLSGSSQGAAEVPQHAGKKRTLGAWEDSLDELIPHLH